MAFDPNFAPDDAPARVIQPISRGNLKKWLSEQLPFRQSWVEKVGFTAEPGSVCLLPDDGTGMLVLFGWDRSDFWAWAQLPGKLPPGDYRIEATWSGEQARE